MPADTQEAPFTTEVIRCIINHQALVQASNTTEDAGPDVVQQCSTAHRSDTKLLEAARRVCSSPSSRRCLPALLLAPNHALNRGKLVSPASGGDSRDMLRERERRSDIARLDHGPQPQ